MDKDKNIDEYKKIWFEKVEKDSENLFQIAQNALNAKNVKKVVIIKRLPRHDRSSRDLFRIKSDLSKFANSIYDHLWIKMGSPQNVNIIELDLEGSKSFQDLIYGSPNSQFFDGIHLNGKGAGRQFTYQTIKQFKSKVFGTTQLKPKPVQKSWGFDNDHTNCPQALYQKRKYESQSYQRHSHQTHNKPQSYADAVRGNSGLFQYNIPTYNRYNSLNY